MVHRRRAKHQLLIEPLCRMCHAKGSVVPATVADHITPHDGDWNEFRTGALQSLCVHCHNNLKQQIEVRGYTSEIAEDGWPLDPNHPTYHSEASLRPKFRMIKAQRKSESKSKSKRNAQASTDGAGDGALS
jgi:hypothetical protein